MGRTEPAGVQERPKGLPAFPWRDRYRGSDPGQLISIQGGDQAVRQMLDAHHPMLAISDLGLPGCLCPHIWFRVFPWGCKSVASRFCEHQCLAAGRVIEECASVKTPIDPPPETKTTIDAGFENVGLSNSTPA
jgi:hypothetical protein